MVSPLNVHRGFPSHKILHSFPLFPFYLVHARRVSSPLSALHPLLTDMKYFRSLKSSWQSSLRNGFVPAKPFFCSHGPQTCSSQLTFKTPCSFTSKSSVGHLTFVFFKPPTELWSSHKSDLPSYFHPVQLTFVRYPQVIVIRLGQTEKSKC